MTYTHSTTRATAEADDALTKVINEFVAQQKAWKVENSKGKGDTRHISGIASSPSVLAEPLSPAANDLPLFSPARQQPAACHALPEPTLAPPVDVRRLPTSTSRDFRKMPRPVWLVHDMFHGGEVIMLWGESQAGKTVLLLDLVAAIAGGSNWAGLAVTQTNVVYVAREGQIGLRARVLALEHDRGPGSQDCVHYVFEPCSVALEDDVNALAATALMHEAKFIVIDTLSASIAGKVDENSNTGMAGVIANLQRLTQMTGAAVLFVHHTGNDPTRGARGAYALHANPDVSIEVGRSEKAHYWRLDKSRDGKLDVGGKFKIDPVTFTPDPEQEPLESIVVRHLDGEGASPVLVRPPRGAKALERAKRALAAIRDHLLARRGADGLPAATTISMDEARSVVWNAFRDDHARLVAAGAIKDDRGRHRADQVRKSLELLIDSRQLERDGDTLRLPA